MRETCKYCCAIGKSAMHHIQATRKGRRSQQGAPNKTKGKARWTHDDSHLQASQNIQPLQHANWHGAFVRRCCHPTNFPDVILIRVTLIIPDVDALLQNKIQHMAEGMKLRNEVVPSMKQLHISMCKVQVLKKKLVARVIEIWPLLFIQKSG